MSTTRTEVLLEQHDKRFFIEPPCVRTVAGIIGGLRFGVKTVGVGKVFEGDLACSGWVR